MERCFFPLPARRPFGGTRPLMDDPLCLSIEERSGLPSIECLNFIAKTFTHAVWLSLVPAATWDYTRTIGVIRDIFPMFELTIDELEQAVTYLMKK